jgi:glutamate decarboxylase
MVMGSNVQVVWEKFCRYWDVEPRYVPITTERFVVDADQVVARVDENAIGVVPTLGTTFTGEFEPIEQIHDRVVAKNAQLGLDVPIHVDAASAASSHPSYGPISCRTSRSRRSSRSTCPDTSTDSPTRASGSTSGVRRAVLQLRPAGPRGLPGRIMERLRDVAVHVADGLSAIGPFEVLAGGTDLPVVAVKLSGDVPFNVLYVSERLRTGGWQVPVYTMPADAADLAVSSPCAVSATPDFGTCGEGRDS